MTTAVPRIARFALLLVLASVTCGPKKVQIPVRESTTTVVLLRDADTDTVGQVRVSNAAGTIELTTDRASVTVRPNESPREVIAVSDELVTQLFGEALAALPAPPMRFTLHFRLGSDALTDESKELVTHVLQTVRERSAPYVIVVGHTDTSGKDDANFALGLTRATAIRNLLVSAGLDASAIEVISLGERGLLIPTPDDMQEPRNRRVEVSVR